MSLPVPPSLDALDAATLTALLGEGGQGPSGTVTCVTRLPFGTGHGFLGDLARLALSYEPGGPAGPATVVAKMPTADPGGRAVGRLLGAWPRESRFFAELAARAGAPVPRCYYNGADPAADRWLLLLEDCGDTEASQHEGATAAHAEAAVTALVALHAPWEGPGGARRPAPWLPGFDRGPLDALESVVVAAVEPFLERFGDHLPSPTPDWLRTFAPQLSGWAAQRAAGPLTLVHADYRLDNLVLRDGTVIIVDWQTALMGPGAMDLASLLATSLTVDDRRAWEDGLMTAYATGMGGRHRDEVRRDVGEHLLWWMALYANNLSRLDPADEARTATLVQMATRIFTAAADHGVGALLPGR